MALWRGMLWLQLKLNCSCIQYEHPFDISIQRPHTAHGMLNRIHFRPRTHSSWRTHGNLQPLLHSHHKAERFHKCTCCSLSSAIRLSRSRVSQFPSSKPFIDKRGAEIFTSRGGARTPIITFTTNTTVPCVVLMLPFPTLRTAEGEEDIHQVMLSKRQPVHLLV